MFNDLVSSAAVECVAHPLLRLFLLPDEMKTKDEREASLGRAMESVGREEET
ncbi:hypothetical protein E2C01_088550 [Portunus trituberculatus]|uniref:Uncharacterized protein n=1 Tax=Portunus trituberculatus TaxID=210409 RepID=A0A5B7JM70_PORTR|nr:hypothetical protein [Portunus trituberculatus]